MSALNLSRPLLFRLPSANVTCSDSFAAYEVFVLSYKGLSKNWKSRQTNASNGRRSVSTGLAARRACVHLKYALRKPHQCLTHGAQLSECAKDKKENTQIPYPSPNADPRSWM